MRRNSRSYRLQLIKETVEKQNRRLSSDPMVRHIDQLLSENPVEQKEMSLQNRFSGYHYDDHVGGWVDDRW